jgi:hypothetical protein
VEPAFKLTVVVKNPAATSLYSVDPLDPNHDATMRIEGEAPKQQQPILFPGAKTMGGRRAAATFFPVQKPWGDGGLPLPRIVFWPFRRYARRGAKTLYLFFSTVADYAAECSLKPSGMTPSFA